MTEWKKIQYLRQGESRNYDYTLTLPTPLADWDVFDYWERERVESMRTYLNKNDVLFDIGAEMGWLSVVYAAMCDVFLIEPTKEFWPNIREIWKHNYATHKPVGYYQGLIGDKVRDLTTQRFDEWPDASIGEMIDKNKYQYLHQHDEDTKEITIDQLVLRSGIDPTALTIDVEGAEAFVLRGAIVTLQTLRPKVWVSIHPDLMKKQYGIERESIFELMDLLSYDKELLAIDHEEHWLFLPDKL